MHLGFTDLEQDAREALLLSFQAGRFLYKIYIYARETRQGIFVLLVFTAEMPSR
jgi:hypothetical protein